MDSFSSADTITDAEWDRVIAVNLTAPIKMMRQVLPFLLRNKVALSMLVARLA
jgi:NAD(P)-dependent dehydrogenase (short-subunit alcohol dehydrogenase family)